AQGSYKKYDYKAYDKIPFNASQLHDVVIRHLDLGTDSVPLKTDIALRRAELTAERDDCVRGWVEDIGDLEGTYGYDELDANGLRIVQGKIYPQDFPTEEAASMNKAWACLNKSDISILVWIICQDRLN